MFHVRTSEQNLFYLKLCTIALVIFGTKLWVIHNFGSPVPFWDQWNGEAANLLLPWLKGTLTFSDLFAAHNEHRIVFTRLLSLSLFILNDRQWDPLLGMVINAFFSTVTAVMLVIVLNNFLGKTVQNSILFTVTLLWAIPYAAENTLSSFQSQFYFLLLFTLIALWGLLYDNFSLKWWIGVLFALAAVFTGASGFFILLVFLVIQLYLIVIDVGNRKSHLPTLFISLGIITLALILIVRVPAHDVLIAKSVSEFMLTFGQALAWPWIKNPWISLLLYLPFLSFVIKILWQSKKPSKGELFVLALGGWVILQVLAMAYARGAGGALPQSRYMDILALGVLVNLLSIHFLVQTGLTCFWHFIIIIGLLSLEFTMLWPTMQQKQTQSIEKLTNTREFLRTGELHLLQKKPLIYPQINILANLLANPQLREILPHRLTVAPLLQSHEKSEFIIDGFYPSMTKDQYKNEKTLGSFNRLGSSAVGHFESELMTLKHGFMEIQVAGYLGEKGLALILMVEGQSAPIIITPPNIAGENWVSCYVRTPKQPFKIVAIDNRPDSWFAFAMPRSLGTLSFLSIMLLEQAVVFLFIGFSVLFILFCQKVLCT